MSFSTLKTLICMQCNAQTPLLTAQCRQLHATTASQGAGYIFFTFNSNNDSAPAALHCFQPTIGTP